MQFCVQDATIGGILSFFFFYLLLTISLKENERKFASGLILCETAHSPVICGTPSANIHEFLPGGGDSAPCADPEGVTPQSQVIWVSIEISIWNPPPPWKMLDPHWILGKAVFTVIKPLDPLCKL